MRQFFVRLLLSVGLLAGTFAALDAQTPPPGERWYTFDTQHFRIHYHEGLESVARRAAHRAEIAHGLLTREFLRPPGGKIDLVVTDNMDLSNGYATPFPTNRVVIFTHPPMDASAISFMDDWLEFLITHELVHIFHLDHAGGLWRTLRDVFGRSPLLFPQVYTPGWVTEGLAVYYESLLTRAGRVRGTEHEMVLRTAILGNTFFPIDRATGSPATWPTGAGDYIYGSLFINHVAEQHGTERLGTFVERVSRQLIPYRMDGTARRTFGVTFSRAWREWEDSLRVHHTTIADSLRTLGLTEPKILTREGRFAHHPRFAPDGRSIIYTAQTGRDEPALRLIHGDGQQTVLARVTTLDPAAWLPDGGLLLSQVDFQDLYRLYADLYRVESDGSRVRLTHGTRLMEPDPHPDGRRLAAIQSVPGTTIPVLLDLPTGEVRPLREPDPHMHWGAPSWSPTGERLALTRWQLGGFFDVVVLDSAGTLLREITRDRALNADPVWSPDGRYILFSSDRTGIPNLYAYDFEEQQLRQVTNVLSGAFQPDVSPDGQWIAFSYYQPDGYYIARIPFDPAAWRAPLPVRPAVLAGPVDPTEFQETAGGPSRSYSPWPTVAPASWFPLFGGGDALGTGLGVALFGIDVLQRHEWNASALLYPRETRLDFDLNYRYRGWENPLLDLSGAQAWTVLAESVPREVEPGDTLRSALLLQEQRVASFLNFQHRRWRSVYSWGGGGDLIRAERFWDTPAVSQAFPIPALPLDVGAVVFGGYSSVRGYAFSISPEEGFLLSLTSEVRRYTGPLPGEEAARGYLRFIGRGHTFYPFPVWGFARHVAALRATGGLQTGTRGTGFSVGGTQSAALPLALDIPGFGVGRTFPVRGYAAGAQQGNRAASATAEYRFPLLLLERGVRTWPIFLGRSWGDLFVDTGAAWCAGECDRQRFPAAPLQPRPLVSVGAEANVSFTFGYFVPLVLRAGYAVPLTPIVTWQGTQARPQPQFYIAAGPSF